MTKNQCPLGDACDLELVCSCSLTTAWMAGAAKAQDQIKAQAAEIERLRGDLAKAMLIIEAYSDDEGYIPKRVVHLWNALHCSNQEGICHCGTLWNAAPQP